MRKLTAFILLLTLAALAQWGPLGGDSVDTGHYEDTLEKTAEIKEGVDAVTHQVDQVRDFLVVLFGDHGMPDPFEKVEEAEENAGTLEGSLAAAEKAQAEEYLGNFWDLPETIQGLLEDTTELLPVVIEDQQQVADDISEHPASAGDLKEIQENLSEANDNLTAAQEQLPMIAADVETITVILQAVLGE